MAFHIYDRVKVQVTPSGTGDVTLGSALLGFRTFATAGFSDGDTTVVTIAVPTTGEWETCQATYNSSGPSVTRGTVLSSSNSNTRVTFAGGTTGVVYVGLSAEKAITKDSTQAELSTLLDTVFGGSSGQVLTRGASLWSAAAASGGGGGLYDISAGVPASSGFSWHNQGSSTITEVSGKAHILLAGTAGTSDSWTIRYKTAPSTPFTLTALLQGHVDAGSYGKFGLGFFDGTKLHYIGLNGQNDTLAPGNISVTRFSDYATYVSHDANRYHVTNGHLFFQIADDGTNVAFRFSYDGVYFTTVFSVAKSSGYLGSGGYTNVFWGNAQRGASGGDPQRTTLRLWDTGTRSFP